ncbi:MAG TPA: glycoside hydrolase family 15 protein [Nevskiaceae bacterium]|nr:glycoside hydrolase family 15 protein [Nevskiaceae bacterium]
MAAHSNQTYSHNTPLVSAHDFLHDPTGLRQTLEAHKALEFPPYTSGLYPACALPPHMAQTTGYGMAWMRDNVHIAHALQQSGNSAAAARTGQAILNIFKTHYSKDPGSRPPVRVVGDTLAVDTDIMRSKQNDSIGYALWLASRFITNNVLEPTKENIDTVMQTVRYLDHIQYWQDDDSGHWEEARKVNASSIGTVVAGLKAVKAMGRQTNHNIDLDELIGKGVQSLQAILPYETRQPAEAVRRYDAALLFLVEPLNIVSPEQAEKIVQDISIHLVRDKGIIRYPGDTYWAPDFKSVMDADERTTSAPGRLEQRNLLAKGIQQSKTEAQWTLFDPILSVYWGRRGNRERQLLHLDRSLAQLTPSTDGQIWHLPEAYFLENGQWVPNDHRPILWAQANLLLALNMFEATTSQG